MVNVLCIKWGSRYGADYVNRLASMVDRHLHQPHKFICLTDDPTGIDDKIETRPIPAIEVPEKARVSPWQKLAVFSPELADIEGKTLFLDLDTIILEELDPFFDQFDDLTIIENWTQKGRGIGNSSVFLFRPGKHVDIFEEFARNADEIVRRHDNEQTYLSRFIGKDLKFWPEQWCRSFKFHAIPSWPARLFSVPKPPENCRILVFHGHPDPDEAAAGKYRSWRKYFRPATWIEDHWR